MSVEVQARVRCNGRMHTVSVVDGALSLDDHRDDEATAAFVALGGDLPRCHEILEAWRDERKSGLPSALRLHADRAKRIRSKRRENPPARPDGRALRSSLRRRAEHRYAEQVSAAVEDMVAGLLGTDTVKVTSRLTTSRLRTYVSGPYNGQPLTVEFTAPWINRLWRTGKAVQGNTIVESIDSSEPGMPARFRAVTFDVERSGGTKRLPPSTRLTVKRSEGWAFPKDDGTWRFVTDEEASRSWAAQQVSFA